jgi:hypothetical protein
MLPPDVAVMQRQSAHPDWADHAVIAALAGLVSGRQRTRLAGGPSQRSLWSQMGDRQGRSRLTTTGLTYHWLIRLGHAGSYPASRQRQNWAVGASVVATMA